MTSAQVIYFMPAMPIGDSPNTDVDFLPSQEPLPELLEGAPDCMDIEDSFYPINDKEKLEDLVHTMKISGEITLYELCCLERNIQNWEMPATSLLPSKPLFGSMYQREHNIPSNKCLSAEEVYEFWYRLGLIM